MKFGVPTLEDPPGVDGKRVLVRCDFNVPLKDGSITDDLRVRAAIPTLEALLNQGARLVVCSHLGRPKGKTVDELRLAPVGERLSELLGRDVVAAKDVVGEDAKRAETTARASHRVAVRKIDSIEESSVPARMQTALSRLPLGWRQSYGYGSGSVGVISLAEAVIRGTPSPVYGDYTVPTPKGSIRGRYA